MPIRIQNDLPAKEILENENIFVMDEDRAVHQDIRPLKVLILNVMPLKRRDGTSDSPPFVELSAADGRYLFNHEKPCVAQYLGIPFKQVLFLL